MSYAGQNPLKISTATGSGLVAIFSGLLYNPSKYTNVFIEDINGVVVRTPTISGSGPYQVQITATNGLVYYLISYPS